MQKEISFIRGFISYTQNNNLVYECKVSSMKFYISGMFEWKSKDIYDNSSKNLLYSVQNTKNITPNIKNINGQLYFFFNGGYFMQDPITIQNNVINIYVVYRLDPIASSRDTSFTIQNTLFGAMQITKNATDNSKNNYKGYGICFDERSQFGDAITEDGRAHTTNGRDVLIFGVDEF